MQLSDINKITGEKPKVDKRTFTVVPYSPVFIGSGMSMRKGLDFYSSQGKTHFFDLQKIYKSYLDELDSLEQALLNGSLDLFISGKGGSISTYTKQTVKGDVLGQDLLQPIRDGFGSPILPGSSLKGSIRTALFAQLFGEKGLRAKEYSKLINGRKVNAKQLENLLLSTQKGGKAPNYDLGRVLRISDATFKPGDLEVFNSVVVNETNRGYLYKIMGRSGSNSQNLLDATYISTLALSFDADLVQPAVFSMSIDKTALKSINWKDSFDFNYVANACNNLSKRLMQYEIDYFSAALADLPVLNVIKEEYELLKEDVEQCVQDTENGKPCWMMRTGWGSGWLSMTGGHGFLTDPDGKEYINSLKKAAHFLFKRTKGFEYPKTRKVVLDVTRKPASTMGWLLVEQQS